MIDHINMFSDVSERGLIEKGCKLRSAADKKAQKGNTATDSSEKKVMVT